MKKKANVLRLMDFSPQYQGSFIMSMLALESELNKKGSIVVWVFPKKTEQREWVNQLQNNGRKVFFLPDNILKSAILVRRLVKEYNVGIIHSHFGSMNLHFPSRVARLGRRNIKYIIHIHSNLKKDRNKLIEGIRKFTIKADLYICVSKALQKIISDKGYKSVAVENAVDFSRLDNFETIDRSEFSIPQGNKTVLMFGYNIHIKGVDVALKAIEKYDTNRQITLLLVVANYLEEVKSGIVDTLGEIPEWVKILPPRNDIATYFNLSDVLLSASRLEGCSNAIIESAYVNTPIVATDIPGQNERRIPGIVWIEKENERQLYEALLAVFSRTYEEGKETLKKAKEYVIENCDTNKWSKKITEIYYDMDKINFN